MQLPQQSILQRTMYDPWFEHDGCGIGFVARINGQSSHDILEMAITALGNLRHRGAVADDARTGDGAGVLTQIPRALMLRSLTEQGVDATGENLAVGMLFLPNEPAAAARAATIIAEEIAACGMRVLGWREVPTNDDALGRRALEAKPLIRQVIIARARTMDDVTCERRLYLARKAMEKRFCQLQLTVYIPSLSSRTIVYKGLLLGTHLAEFYPDLRNPAYQTAIAVYHQRYSTNTFPTWERAQPFRMLSHNGEINTLQGNVNWMRARQVTLRFATAEGDPVSVAPVLDEEGSDSAMLDNALELLVMGGRDVRHALAMLVPEAWEKIPDMPQAQRDFYQFHACLTEPWDGPAALTFSDGRIVGTTLDRNGLRPARYLVTDDGLVLSGSEAGMVPVDEQRIVHKGKLGPGQMIAVDTVNGRLYTNEEIKTQLAAREPYGRWIQHHLRRLDEHSTNVQPPAPLADLSAQQMAFGYTDEELNVVIKPMITTGQEPVGSMGDDTPAAVFSQLELGRPLFQFFKQRFAEVTNPPIDSLREESVMSLSIAVGRRLDILHESPEHVHLLRLPSPILTDAQITALRAVSDPLLETATVSALVPITAEGVDLAAAVRSLCVAAEQASIDGASVVIVSDRGVDATHAPIPSLLATAAVHHHLIRTGWRSRVSMLVESGEPREVHHIACLVGYGAEAVNPYLALQTARTIAAERAAVKARAVTQAPLAEKPSLNGRAHTLLEEAEQNFVHALEKGLLKIMSKMGIATIDSYCGAQIFEAVGIDQTLVNECFIGTPSRIGGIGFPKIEQDMLARHARAFAQPEAPATRHPNGPQLPHTGFYKFKRDGEYHAFNPAVIRALHNAVQNPHALNADGQTVSVEGYEQYRRYADLINQRPPTEPRDLFEFIPAGAPIPLDEVESVDSIVRRFSTAAMSHGSTSLEAHETLAIAMNRLGGMSNSGEGGEAPERYGNERNSRIKQVASGRFGVTPAYLASASELQIKMAQGSKPGEGGQLPGHKVNAEIALIRHTIPGVSLISPPPHHDIYSIEDLAQLIYDLKQVNANAVVSVKLVATAGVGTIAAGVAKGYADLILISGHSGGTGASPLSSIKNAGIPWELGLAETQQTLVLNGLRGRIRLRADGGMKVGRDIVIAALLGADEYSFGTTVLVAEGCIMARACHSNTCPVGVATQRPELRAKFAGKPEMVMAFFRFLAQEVREILATLGLRSVEAAVGRTDLLRQRVSGLTTADLIDLEPVLAAARLYANDPSVEIRHGGKRNPLPAGESLNDRIIHDTQAALAGHGPIALTYPISNCDRSVGTRLSGTIGQIYGDKGLPAQTITLNLHGSAGQSLGAFNAPGIYLDLVGEANDYVGKGMAGGTIIVRPSAHVRYTWHENVIAGNTLLYGATGGELFVAGRVGERFAVRNSGVTAVVEGVGDHGCEYMTGGIAVVLGATGRNFGAGMTGGVAYVLDEAGTLGQRYNPQLVQLDPLSSQDEAQLLKIIRRHLELTGSPHANDILERWETHYRPMVKRVMPREAVAKIEAAVEGTEPEGAKVARKVAA